ncbi:hypothetical protein B0T26DRAFT_497640 [Lasiosphaeria miniovina]|uniref:Uncharacterized protein n=1 Tax=Lasiosphaeria miniovina TaxID=1954250 RepID=A0AA40DJA1_9PEZI|nr:uncharacterized protein B0T26DRAFT_497640 [Lasiosphaeria miniovina]KAK0703416.1 hypothetical protein B0T26DRAFT_497640 [Lasiosphaeria miniovina]
MFTDDGKGNLYILDFGHASFLPLSCMAFALRHHHPSSWLVADIRDRVGLIEWKMDADKNKRLERMAWLRYVFATSSQKIGTYGVGSR